MKNNQKCKNGVYKFCMECERSFVDTVWCGELLCNRCLEMCWLVDNVEIAERVLGCCDYHRPSIALSNVVARSEPQTSRSSHQIDGIISYSKTNVSEFTTPLGNFKSFATNLPQKSESISIPSKKKQIPRDIQIQSHEKNVESKSLPTIPDIQSKSQILQQNNPTASTSFSDGFFKAEFFSKFLPKSFK